jgi:hypothetical protein
MNHTIIAAAGQVEAHTFADTPGRCWVVRPLDAPATDLVKVLAACHQAGYEGVTGQWAEADANDPDSVYDYIELGLKEA